MKVWIGKAEDSEFVLIEQYNMLLTRNGNGDVNYCYFEAEIDGDSFEIIMDVGSERQSIKFKIAAEPSWVTRFIMDKVRNDVGFFKYHFVRIADSKKSTSDMIGEKVSFSHNGENLEGIIKDKLNIPIASNPPRGYTPMDNYLIVQNGGNIFIINPINLDNIIK